MEQVTRILRNAVALAGTVIERQGEADWLRSAGATYGQGYLFASPLPAAQLEGGP